jgi:hypothetical protein
MTTIEVEEIITQDDSSGRVHRRFKVPFQQEALTFEADNLDRAGDYTVITSIQGIDPTRLCERCFPAGVTS